MTIRCQIHLRIESIELDCPKQTYDWIEYIYVSPLNRRGTFFSLGHLNKKTQKVTVYPGAVYNIKIRTRTVLQVKIRYAYETRAQIR